MAAAAILKNRKTAISRPSFYRFRPNLARRRSSALFSRRSTVKKFEISKIQDDGGHHLEKSPHLGCVVTDFDQIWHSDAVWPSSAIRLLKIWNLKNPRWRWPPSWKVEKLPYLGDGWRSLTLLIIPFRKSGVNSCTSCWLVYALDFSCSFSKHSLHRMTR